MITVGSHPTDLFSMHASVTGFPVYLDNFAIKELAISSGIQLNQASYFHLPLENTRRSFHQLDAADYHQIGSNPRISRRLHFAGSNNNPPEASS